MQRKLYYFLNGDVACVLPAHDALQNGCEGSDADSSADKHRMLRCKDLSGRGAKRPIHIALTQKKASPNVYSSLEVIKNLVPGPKIFTVTL